MSSDRRIVVLDDDPTGTQAVGAVPVVCRWEPEDLRWGLEQAAPLVFVLTNTRARAPATTEQLLREVTSRTLDVAAELGVEVDFVTRSDSTLRGHFPLETDVVDEAMAAHGRGADVLLLVPAYPEAGRVTRGGTHLVRQEGRWVPVGETEFARDATFGYASSDLRDWVAERSSGRWPADQVVHLDLGVVRAGAAGITARLAHERPGRYPVVVTVDAEDGDDLDRVAAGLAGAVDAGVRVLVRSGPSFVRALAGRATAPPLSEEAIAAVSAPGRGLVVVGSHTALTNAQVQRATTGTDWHRHELDVAALLDPGHRGAEVDRVVRRCVASLAPVAGADVVLTTSRALVTGADADASLAVAASVADAVVDTVRAVLEAVRPSWVVAKGGITSSDLLTRTLGMHRARVLGTLLPGMVSVWAKEDPDVSGGLLSEGPRAPLAVVFPGNAGDADALASVVRRMRAGPPLQ